MTAATFDAPTAAVSATEPDWQREYKTVWSWDPPRALLASIRAWQRHRQTRNPLARVLCAWAVLRHRFWTTICGADVPLNCQLGGGLLMPHPNGIVIHPDVRVGPNCLIFQQVTLGSNGHGVPTIGGHVDIGAGAKVLGPLQVGDDARIGANAVVIHDVPAGCTVVGIPARRIQNRS